MSRVQSPGRIIGLVVFLGLFLAGSIGATASGAPSVTIEEVSVADDSVVDTRADGTYVAGWKPLGVNSTVNGDTGDYYACLSIGNRLDSQEIGCHRVDLSESPAEIQLSNQTLPANVSGSDTLRLALYANESAIEPLETATEDVTVLIEGGDPDDDGIITGKEVTNKTDPLRPDTDRDGLTDYQEIQRFKSDPTEKDTDGDGLADGVEVNKYESDPTSVDSDNDGLNDTVEVNQYNTNPDLTDTDDDDLNDSAEIREHETDPLKPDTDGDGLIDGREVQIGTNPVKKDTDGDGLTDGQELGNYKTDPTNPDTDGDGLKDGEEVHKYGTIPSEADSDGDGIDDLTELERGTDPNPQPFYLLEPVDNPVKTTLTGVAVIVLGVTGRYYWRNHRNGAPVQTTTPAPTKRAVEQTEQPPTEPLTDEDHIQQLLGANDGRMHQSDIVESTGWSKSKVSRLLTRMEDDGKISKISVGRENLITRPGDEPKHAGSTLEE